MAITEENRHRLYAKLEEILGPDDANTLMAHLPPVGWADVATKHDVDQLRAATKRDLEHLEVTLRGEIEHLEVTLRGEIERVEAVLDHRLGEKLHREIQAATHAFIGWMLVSNLGVAGAIIAAVKLT